MTTRGWLAGERPREKLLEEGAGHLSDAELLAIFVRVGVKGKSAVDMARQRLSHFGSLRALLTASPEDFCAIPGLGPTEFAQLQAALARVDIRVQDRFVVGDGEVSSFAERGWL